MQGARFRLQEGGTRATCDLLTGLQNKFRESFHLRYPALHKLQMPSHWAPGLQYFHLPTKFWEDSTVG